MTDYLSRWNEYAAAKAALEETTTQLGEGRAQLEALQEKVGQHTTESVTLEDQLKEALATEIASHKEATAAREGKLVEATKALKAGKLEEAYSLLEDSPLCAPFQPTITVQAIKKMVYGIDLERREVVWERPSSDYACRRVWEVVQDDELACVTDGENFAALNKKDGEMVGVSPDGPNQYVRSMQLADGKLVVAQSRHILTLDREGNELWRSDSCERFHELVADDNRVYASGWERITAFDLTYGKTLWKEGNFDCCQQLAVAGETTWPGERRRASGF